VCEKCASERGVSVPSTLHASASTGRKKEAFGGRGEISLAVPCIAWNSYRSQLRFFVCFPSLPLFPLSFSLLRQGGGIPSSSSPLPSAALLHPCPRQTSSRSSSSSVQDCSIRFLKCSALTSLSGGHGDAVVGFVASPALSATTPTPVPAGLLPPVSCATTPAPTHGEPVSRSPPWQPEQTSSGSTPAESPEPVYRRT